MFVLLRPKLEIARRDARHHRKGEIWTKKYCMRHSQLFGLIYSLSGVFATLEAVTIVQNECCNPVVRLP